MRSDRAATRRSLRDDLERLGVQAGDLLMVHGSLRRVGRIVGGVDVLTQALLDVIGDAGTLAAYVDFEPCFEEDDDPADIPVFDKRIAHAARDHGILHETLRNWPGAIRSDHPDAGVVALGRLAECITADHPLQYGYGEGSPFEKIVEGGGRVLMIGAPLDTITLLHHAEHRARVPGKKLFRYRRLLPGAAGPVWVELEEFDTTEPVSDAFDEGHFEQIARDHLAAGFGRQGLIGQGESYLFGARELVAFGITWLERVAQVREPAADERGNAGG